MDLCKCLVVDDDELSREMIVHYLDGYAVCETASNGREALEKAQASHDKGDPFRLIILDIIMPEMDGHEAGKAIRTLEKNLGITLSNQVKIIVLSSVNTPQEIMQAFMTINPAAQLVKPVEPGKFRETLAKIGVRKATR
ncbi:MAG: response regulator [Geobacter sp.]|nr:MAG: response regulator [Geobacter sp.]